MFTDATLVRAVGVVVRAAAADPFEECVIGACSCSSRFRSRRGGFEGELVGGGEGAEGAEGGRERARNEGGGG